MIMIGGDKKRMTASIVDGIVGGKKEYSTGPAVYPESTLMCAHELLKAIEEKNPEKIISAFMALDYECDALSGEEEPDIQL